MAQLKMRGFPQEDSPSCKNQDNAATDYGSVITHMQTFQSHIFYYLPQQKCVATVGIVDVTSFSINRTDFKTSILYNSNL